MKYFRDNEAEFGIARLRVISSLREGNVCCDFMVECGRIRIPTHKVILISGSSYFKTMLLSNMAEAQNNRVNIQGLDPECVKKCIDYIYTGEALDVEDDKQGELLHAAELMQLEGLKNLIIVSLETDLNSKSFFFTKRLANTFNLGDLETKCDQFAKDNFELIATDENFLQMEQKYILFLIASRETKCREDRKCGYLIKWINFDVEKRGKHFSKMFLSLDLTNIPLEYQRYLLENEPLIDSSKECRKLLFSVLMESLKLEAKDTTEVKANSQIQARNTTEVGDSAQQSTKIVVFDRKSKSLQRFEPETKEWTKMHHFHEDMIGGCFTTVLLDDHIYALMKNQSVYRLRYSDMNATWEEIDGMIYYHGFYPPATVLDRLIYVVGSGGYLPNPTNKMEQYNPSTNQWISLLSKNRICSSPSIITAQGLIYSIGGQLRNGTYSNKVEIFDPKTSSWSHGKPMIKPKCGAAAVWDGKLIYVMGGWNGGIMSDVESYDPSNQTWTSMKPMIEKRDWFRAIHIKGRIYAVGGDQSKSIEMFDPRKNEWEVIANLKDVDIKPNASIGI